MLVKQSDEVQQYTKVYDSTGTMDVDCSISAANVGNNCTIEFTFTESVTGPLYVYYEISNFYQNHRRYVKSRSADQLMGSVLTYDDVELDCFPLIENGTSLLSPCGLIANSLFNDIIELQPNPQGVVLDTDGIAWTADEDDKFNQPDGFVSSTVPDPLTDNCTTILGSDYEDCKTYVDSSDNTTYFYWYPDEDTTQYLYESFPTIISPIEGVKNEHFVNWMRTAGLPYFRKLYGKIDADMSPGDTLTFDVTTNFEVTSFGGSKSLVVTTLADFGGKNSALGNSYIIIGVVSIFMGLLFGAKRCLNPRPLGDIRVLGWTSVWYTNMIY